jgi:hypothetical protein
MTEVETTLGSVGNPMQRRAWRTPKSGWDRWVSSFDLLAFGGVPERNTAGRLPHRSSPSSEGFVAVTDGQGIGRPADTRTVSGQATLGRRRP